MMHFLTGGAAPTPVRAVVVAACLSLISPVWGAAQPAYVGSDSCTDCHQDQAESWRGSHHALAWTDPTPENVVADFNDTEFTHDGMTARFLIEPDGYVIEVTEKDGSFARYPVHSVAGIAPLQQYLLETEPGRLQSFDVVWDTVEQRWFHLYPDQDLPPDDGLHWTGPYKNWNARCAECHATGYQRNYAPRTDRYASTQVEIGVGCEACHGPGSAHLDWAAGRSIERQDLSPDGFSVAVNMEESQLVIGQCASCHSRREALGDGNPLPGTAFHDAYTLALLRPGLYHADGQILDEVYVYGSFLQSRMYAKGVSCLNCHDPHGADLVADGNAVCTQCHSEAGNPDFPSLRLAEYDTPAHHFHAEGSEGAQCKSCHMIERVYMGNDGRRDHSFRVPRPDLAAQTGGPNACTDCHADQTPDWAAVESARRFPDSAHRGPHYGPVLAAGRRDPASVAEDLMRLAENTEQPGIVRATALDTLQGQGGVVAAARLAPLLSDADPVVRSAAANVQRALPPENRADALMPVLRDPHQSVRIAAARALLDVPAAAMRPSQAALLERAMGEWRASISNKLDYPETHMVLGGMALTFRNLRAAASAFRRVVELDPQRSEAWVMLVRIASAEGGPTSARRVLDEAVRKLPADPALQQMRQELDR